MKRISTPMLVVAVALVDRSGAVLMQRRRLDRTHGGLWEFPGGKVESGESPETALLREIDEELGLAIRRETLQPLTFAATAPEDDRPLVILLYVCRSWEGKPQCLEAEEIAWFAAADLARLPMPPLDYPLARALVTSMTQISS